MKYQFHSAICFRVATDPTTGFGHMSRMRALRKVFKEPVKWFVDPRTKKEVSEWVPKTDEVYEETAIILVVKPLGKQIYRLFVFVIAIRGQFSKK